MTAPCDHTPAARHRDRPWQAPDALSPDRYPLTMRSPSGRGAEAQQNTKVLGESIAAATIGP